MKNAPVINPNAVFDRQALRDLLQVRDSTIGREIRLGRLRVARRAGKHFFLGVWVLEWLTTGEVKVAGTVPVLGA